MGKQHANNARKLGLFGIEAIADISAQRRKEAQAELKVATYEDYKKMLDVEKIEAVFVTTQPNTHAEIAIEAARRGKHVFCEKPFTPSLAEARNALKVIKKKKVVFELGLVLRYTECYNLLKKIISNRELGDIFAAQARYGGYMLSYKPHFDRGYDRGMVNGNTIHMVDMLRYLFGPVKQVWARFDGGFPKGTELAAVISFSHVNGVISGLYGSGAMRASSFLFVNGSDADAIVENNSELTKLDREGSHKLLRADIGFREELEAFWRSIVLGEQSLAGQIETLELSYLMESIYLAAIKRTAIGVPRATLHGTGPISTETNQPY